MDDKKFLCVAETISKFIVDFRKKRSEGDVKSDVTPNYLCELASMRVRRPHTWEETFELVKTKILPGKTNWSHPLFFGFFPAGDSAESILADYLASALNNNGFSWLASPCCVETEVVVLDWLGRAFGLPAEMLPYSTDKVPNSVGGGTILSSASECIFTSLASAVYGAKKPRESLVVYTSVLAHVSVEKACRFLGVLVAKLPVKDDSRSLCAESLERAISADLAGGRVPVAVVLTIGVTSCGAIDDIYTISKITKKHSIYLHVDGAYGGAALLMRKFRNRASLENVDAININPNKCLQTTLCCACLWMKDRQNLLRLQPKAFYLDYSESGDFQFSGQRAAGLSLSRPFRALKLFFVLMMIGVDKLRNDFNARIVSANQIYAELCTKFPRLVFVKPSSLPVFCFRASSDQATLILLRNLNNTRKVYLTPTTLENGVVYIRMSINNHINRLAKAEFYSIMSTQYLKDENPSSLLCSDIKQQRNIELKTLANLFVDKPNIVLDIKPPQFAGTLHLKFVTFTIAYAYLVRLVETMAHFKLPNIETIYHNNSKYIVVFDIDSSRVRKLKLTDRVSAYSSCVIKNTAHHGNLISLDTYILDDISTILLPVDLIRARKC